MPESILNFAKECRINRSEKIDAKNNPVPFEVQLKHNAKTTYEEIFKCLQKDKRESYKNDDKHYSLVGREFEQLKKLALIDCLSQKLADDKDNELLIDKDNLVWGYEVIKAHRKMINDFFDANLYDNFSSKIQQTIISILKEHDKNKMQKSDLVYKLSKRINGSVEFTESEITAICSVLKKNPCEIFFRKKFPHKKKKEKFVDLQENKHEEA